MSDLSESEIFLRNHPNSTKEILENESEILSLRNKLIVRELANLTAGQLIKLKLDLGLAAKTKRIKSKLGIVGLKRQMDLIKFGWTLHKTDMLLCPASHGAKLEFKQLRKQD